MDGFTERPLLLLVNGPQPHYQSALATPLTIYASFVPQAVYRSALVFKFKFIKNVFDSRTLRSPLHL